MLVPNYRVIIQVKLNCSFKFPEHENIFSYIAFVLINTVISSQVFIGLFLQLCIPNFVFIF